MESQQTKSKKLKMPNVTLICTSLILTFTCIAKTITVYAQGTNTPEVSYNLIDLGTLPGGDTSAASSINNNGRIVGYASTAPAVNHATLFDPTGDGNNIDLGTLPGGDYSLAGSISDTGQIVGVAVTPSASDRATLFDPTGQGNNIDLGTLGGVTSWARSVNNSGQIVGYASTASVLSRATLFDSTGYGDNIDLGALPGLDWSYAWSINNSGQIVGDAGTFGTAHATLFDPTGNGDNTDLGTLPDFDTSSARSINNLGQIVGISRIMPGGISRATLFDPTGAGNNIDLGTLPGFNSSASSINNSGQIVGVSTIFGQPAIMRATLFDPTGEGNNIDLNELIDPNLGWTLRSASQINDKGWIVGYGTNPHGQTRGYLLTPALPVIEIEIDIDHFWMYQSLPGQSNSDLTASVWITDDPMGNSSYSYEWEIVLPGDVTLTPVTADGGGAGDAYWTFAARGCDEPGGLSDSGQVFTVRVTLTGDDYANTGQAETEFGIALLGDTNNDGVVNVADRSIANAFWRTGSAGPYTLRDCDVNCDGVVNVADRSIVNAVWRRILGQNSVSLPCPLR